MPAPARWYVLVQGVQEGPFALDDVRDQVRSGAVDAKTWVWADGMQEWRQAHRVPALVPPPGVAPGPWPAQ